MKAVRRARLAACLVGVGLITGCSARSNSISSALSHKPVFLGPLYLGTDLNLPDNPTVAEEVAAGKHQIELLKDGDLTLDHDREALDYFNSLSGALVKGHQEEQSFPIEVHVSSEPIVDAQALPGGQIVVYTRIVEIVDDESEMAGLLAHEISHERHRDFVAFWHDYKQDRPVYGRGGVLAQSRAIEARADEDAVRMVYQAGWDPKGYLAFMRRMDVGGRLRRESHRIFYSTHPQDPERIKALNELISRLPPKPGLVKGAERFQAIKRRL